MATTIQSAPTLKSFLHPVIKGWETRRLLSRLGALLGIIISAVIVGDVIGHEQWLILGVVVAGLMALKWPVEIGLGVYSFLVPFNSVAVLGSGLSQGATINRVLGVLAGMALLGSGVITRRLSWPPRTSLWAALLVLWAALTGLWALQPGATVHMLPTAVSLVLLYLAAVSWRITEKQYQLLSGLILLGACSASLLVIYQFHTGVQYINWQGPTQRASLLVGSREINPNTLATDLLLPFSLAVAEFLGPRRRWRMVLGLLATATIAYAVFLTMSRGSMLAMALMMALYLKRRDTRRRIVAVAGALLLIATAMPSTFYTRLQTIISDAGSGRLDIWSVAVTMLKHYGLAGAGLANFQVAYNSFAGYAPNFVGFGRGAHNMYLEAGVELGIVGVALLLTALIAHLAAVRRMQSASSGSLRLLSLECACWGMLIAGLFEGIVWAKSFWLTWMLCILAVRLARHAPEPASST